MGLIKSVGSSNKEIISNILELHIKDDRFDVDPCFSTGKFYKGLNEPRFKSDIKPQIEGVLECSSDYLPIKDDEVNSIMFDPPFMFGTHGQTKNNEMNKRFSMFDTWEQLEQMYQNSLKEFYRILKPKGHLVFKCQDYTDSKTTMTHCLVYNWAVQLGFYAKDLFILDGSAGGRIYNPNLNQKHARKFHCYFFVFQKL